jgi:oligosaccharide repeat unit polymerase
MSALDLSLAALLALTLLNYWLWRSVLYPPFIFCFMWVFDLATWRMHLIDVFPVHTNTLSIVTGAAAVFTLGGLFASLTPQSLLRPRLFPEPPELRATLVRNILTAIVLCGVPLFYWQVYKISQQGLGANLLMRARDVEVAAAQNGQQIRSFVFDYFVIGATFTALLFATGRRDWKFRVVVAAAFIGCILSTGRTGLLLLIAGLCAIRLLRRDEEQFWRALKSLRWPVLIFLLLYIALIFTNKNTKGVTGGISGIVSYYVVSYIVGPLAAFDAVVQAPGSFMPVSSHVFEFPMKIAAAFHLMFYTAPPKLDTFVEVPFAANVYTVFKYYFLELGVSGTMAIMLVIGLLHSLLYLKAKMGGRLSIYLYAYSIYAVIMVIFDDAYYDVGNYLRAFLFGAVYLALCAYSFHLVPRLRFRPLAVRGQRADDIGDVT